MYQAIHNKIQRSFSRSARQYDLFSGLHREIADGLFAKALQVSSPCAILDVGCGTGYLTAKLKQFFPSSKVIGLDFSKEMLNVARAKHENIDWVLADGHYVPFGNGRFDLLVSNLAYQWALDLNGAFNEAKRVLAPNGILSCTLFGYNTCQELFQSLDEAGAGALQFIRLPKEKEVCEALAFSGFKNADIGSHKFKIMFKDMHDLLAWLKSIGANNLLREGFMGRQMMSLASAIYSTKYSYRQGVGATFEVVRVYAQK